MRGMKWLFVLAMVMIMVSSTAQAQSSTISFSSDQGPSIDRDIWKMRDDGSTRIRLTAEAGDTHRPSVCSDGQMITYDDGDALLIMNSDGTEEKTIEVSGTPCAGAECFDADCGRVLPNGNPKIVFTREYVDTIEKYDIVIATVDMSVHPPELIDIDTIVVDELTGSVNNHEPTWCGGQHIVWSRQEYTLPYKYEICVTPISCLGGPPCAEVCHGFQNNRDEAHPSCNQTGTKIAFAQEQVADANNPWPSDICTVDFDASTMTFSNEDCLINEDDVDDLYDDTHPSWNPGGTQIAFASTRPPGGPDYEIWKMNEDGTFLQQLTPNTDVDDEPNWGPAVLP